MSVMKFISQSYHQFLSYMVALFASVRQLLLRWRKNSANATQNTYKSHKPHTTKTQPPFSHEIINEYKKLIDEALQTLKQRNATIDQLKQQQQQDKEDLEIQFALSLELEEQLNQERDAHNALKSHYDKLKNKTVKNNHAVLVFGKEREKYRGEITDLVLNALNIYINTHINTGQKSSQSRKKHILMDLILANKVCDTREQCLKELKSLFKNYKGVTPKIRKGLKQLGFEIIESHNHNHIRFIGDNRFQVAFAKTPSDYRVGNNIIRDIKSALL